MPDKPKHLEAREINGAREFSPTAGRNTEPLLEQLSPRWPQMGRILEIASGTGQHAAAFCADREDISWQTSDVHLPARNSQNAWACESEGRIAPSLNIDVTAPNWWTELGAFNAMFCANMIHIAPAASVEGLAKGAAAILPSGAHLYLYGPFQEGESTAASNLAFDQSLKSRDSDWGVRHLANVKHIFATCGLNLSQRIIMPKENRLLVFTRSL